jgi:ubiquinol-cytochrome c reductase cytochrome b subunit
MASILDINRPAGIVRWHFFQMSVANILVLVATLALFALVRALPFERLWRRGSPARPWTYFCALAALALLIVLMVSGLILAVNGSAWWHDSNLGLFVNSVHLWAVELFFALMVINLAGQLFTGAWRDGGTRLWLTGALGFLVAIPTALTGYIAQQNFDAQWIAIEARDGLNAIGAGAFFNTTDFGQMYTYHTLVLPFALALLVTAHVLLVRARPVTALLGSNAHASVPVVASATPPAAGGAHL